VAGLVYTTFNRREIENVEPPSNLPLADRFPKLQVAADQIPFANDIFKAGGSGQVLISFPKPQFTRCLFRSAPSSNASLPCSRADYLEAYVSLLRRGNKFGGLIDEVHGI